MTVVQEQDCESGDVGHLGWDVLPRPRKPGELPFVELVGAEVLCLLMRVAGPP